MDDANAAIVQVGQVQPFALGVERDTVNAPELRLRGRATIAAEALLTCARYREDDTGLGIDLADAIVQGIGEINVAVGRDREAMHAVELGLERRAAVAAVALLTGTRNGRQDALPVHFAHPLAGQLHEE